MWSRLIGLHLCIWTQFLPLVLFSSGVSFILSVFSCHRASGAQMFGKRADPPDPSQEKDEVVV